VHPKHLHPENRKTPMSLDQAYQDQGLVTHAVRPCVTRVHVHASPLLRAGLEEIFEGMPFVMSDAALHGPFLPSGSEETPELFIVEEKSCSRAAPELIGELKAYNPAMRVILLADQFEFHTLVSARRAGVDGFCLTTSSSDVLIHSIALVMLGESVLPWANFLPFMKDNVHDTDRLDGTVHEGPNNAASQKSLSSREVEVLDCLREGAPNKTIARKLNVAEATVKAHLKAILRKLGVGNRSQAALWAAYHLPLEAAPDGQSAVSPAHPPRQVNVS
jgi:two-component system nitrate/nitrite response regulator NarL